MVGKDPDMVSDLYHSMNASGLWRGGPVENYAIAASISHFGTSRPIPPLSNESMSRESIYTREDDWNRWWTSLPIQTLSFTVFTAHTHSTVRPETP